MRCAISIVMIEIVRIEAVLLKPRYAFIATQRATPPPVASNLAWDVSDSQPLTSQTQVATDAVLNKAESSNFFRPYSAEVLKGQKCHDSADTRQLESPTNNVAVYVLTAWRTCREERMAPMSFFGKSVASVRVKRTRWRRQSHQARTRCAPSALVKGMPYGI